MGRVLLGSLLLLCGCTKGCGTPGGIGPAGSYHIEFLRGGTVELAKDNALAFHQQQWSLPTLGNVPSLPLNADSNLSLRYHADEPRPALYENGVMLFARDPNESFTALTSQMNDDAGWIAQTSNCQSPTALVINWPQIDLITPGSPVTYGPLKTADFWGKNCDGVPAGPGAAPGGAGSIKGVRRYERGACSHEIALSDNIIKLVQDTLFAQFSQKVVADGCADAEQDWQHGASYLTASTTLDPDIVPRGGFILNSFFQAKIKVPGYKDTNVRFNANYEFRLTDGILDAVATLNGLDTSGHSDDDARASFTDALNNQVPQGIHAAAATGPSGQFFDYPIAGPCTQDTPGDPSIPAGSSTCNISRSFLTNSIESAKTDGLLHLLASNDPGADGDRLKATVEEVQGGKLRNWRCMQRDAGFRCEYLLRAQRLNVYPDTVELVWFDSIHDTFSTALPLYVALRDQPGTLFQQGVQKLCSPLPQQGNLKRAFARSNLGDNRVEAFKGVADCLGSAIGNLLVGIFSNILVQQILAYTIIVLSFS